MVDISVLKAQIRSVLLSLGKTATEQEFRKAYYEIEGTSFNEVLRNVKLNFYDLFLRIPDVAKIVYAHNQVFIQRVSNQATSHMENLTVNKYSKKYRGPKLVTKSGAIKGRPTTNPLSVKALPYPTYTAPQRRVVPFQQAGYGQSTYQRPAQNNFNMKVSVGSSSSRNVQCYYSDNESWNKQGMSFGTSKQNQETYNASVSNTSTKKEIKPEIATTQLPQTSNIVTSSDTLSKTSRIPQTNGANSISTNPDNGAAKFAQDVDDKSSVKSQRINSLDDRLKTPKKKEVEPPKATPMASSKITPTASTSKPKSIAALTNLLKSNKQNNDEKDLTRLDALADRFVDQMESLNLNDTEKKESVIENEKPITKTLVMEEKENVFSRLNPEMVKNRLRSMRLFREALKDANLNEDKSSQGTEQLPVKTEQIIELPEPIQNEMELYFFIKIIDVASPAKFVFQFSFEKLKELSFKMNSYYNNLHQLEAYQVKELIKDNIVAIRRNEFWYRGQIKSFNETDAYVQLVDTMKILPEKVSYKNIFILHQKFTTESPKSAIGKIYGLKPKDGEWNMLSTAKMSDIHGKMVLATVKCVENNVYSLSIIADTRNFTRLCDLLVEEDLAEVELEDFANEPVFRSLV